MKKLLIAIACIGAVCTGAAVIYGPTLARNMAPQFFIARAVANTARDYIPALNAMHSIASEAQHAPLRSEATLGISQLGGHFEESLPGIIRSGISMASLRTVARMDASREVHAAELSLQMMATTLITANIHLDRDRIAVGVPALFDYSLAIDPRSLGRELDESVLRDILLPPGVIDDEEFYRIYRELFELRVEDADFAAFRASLLDLARYMEFEYLGTYEDMDRFRIIIPFRQANATITTLVNGDIFTDDIPFTLYIDGNRLVRVDFVTPMVTDAYSWHFTFEEGGAFQFQLIGLVNTVTGDVNVRNHDFNFHIDSQEFGLRGSARLFPDTWRVETNFSVFMFTDVTLNANLLLFEDTEPIIFDEDRSRRLPELNILDLIGIFERLEQGPLWGIIGNLLS